jgi:hypothetical protein
VPKEQYRLLKAHILSRHKKRKTTKKGTTRSRKGFSSGRNSWGPVVIQGRGGYFTDKLAQGASAGYRALQRGIPAGTFDRFGSAVGGGMFGKYGASLGGSLGRGVSSILGFGDYAIRKNDLLTIDEGVPVPTFADLNQGIVICHREYLGDVTQSQTFSLTSYPINPGLPSTFPWLSTIAPNFDQYEILGMLFQFRSTASDFGTTTNMAMGSIILSTEYDTVDANYQSKLEMENAQYAMSGKPSQDQLHPIECDPSLTGPMGLKYVRTGNVPSGKDIRLYDHGNFQIATTGMPASSGTIGELWVTYKIAFYKPQFSMGTGTLTDWFTGTASANSMMGGLSTSANNSIGGSVSGNTYTFPARTPVGTYYLAWYYLQGDATLIVTPEDFSALNNCVQVYKQTGQGTGAVNGVTLLFKVTAANPTLVVNNGTIPTNQVKAFFFVTQVDTDVASNGF